MKNSRVKTAYLNTWRPLRGIFTAKGLDADQFELYLRIFKQEGILEAWVRQKKSDAFTLLKEFSVCAKSGTLGPKRYQGDGQVPEGFYDISQFQPFSSYHLALKVSYPNKRDKLLAGSRDPGGDIMIHGNCVTIGCVPIQDKFIEELYVLCVEARNHGHTIRSDIYPFRFSSKDSAAIYKSTDASTRLFWNSLRKGYDAFERSKKLPSVTIDVKGNYVVN